MDKTIKKISSKPKSSRHKTKSKSRTKKKKLSKCVNFHIILDESSSDSSNSENNTTSSENELETNTLALTKARVLSSSETSSKSSEKVSINSYNMINSEFIALKDPVLNHFTSNFSNKECEKFWHEITIKLLSYLKRPYKLIGAEVDKNKKPSVKLRNNSLESSGISYNISVIVGQRKNRCTISEDFPVIDDDKPWILLDTPWLDLAGRSLLSSVNSS
ncbi:hypothetical protein F8M41_016378 [Gigaspora margarita]|uniref:Uncharacterized protein n=1 Tax=Gigaspora margarita TaxID=4874 RepID=A0A8H4APE5_GIGMA|nr:hypothetical protein F8M41_016378 [Gigaspora margarita]